jgi:hypothetical protein
MLDKVRLGYVRSSWVMLGWGEEKQKYNEKVELYHHSSLILN